MRSHLSIKEDVVILEGIWPGRDHLFRGLSLLILILLALAVAAEAQAASPRVIGYYVQWATYERNYEPADIPAAKLTHINYAFVEVRNSGELYSIDEYADFQKVYPAKNGLPAQTYYQSFLNQAGNFGRLRDLKALYPRLKVLIALGGWGWSGTFSVVAADPARRAAFAASCAAWVSQQGMDGIDLDWEFPASSEKANFTALLQAVRQALLYQGQLDGKTYLLTVAAPAWTGSMGGFDIPAVAGVVDWINLMTYDYHGSTWDSTTGFNAPLYADPDDPSPLKAALNIDWTVNAYLSGGAPAGKLTLGLPLYGRSWEAVADVNHGLYQTGQAGPNTGTDGNWQNGVFDYWRVLQLLSGGSYSRYWNSASLAPFLYGPNITVGLTGGLFLSYDDTQSVGEKLSYLKSKNLGGAMFWELSGDVRNAADPDSLVGLVAQTLLTAPVNPGALLLLLSP
jgi:chitinase